MADHGAQRPSAKDEGWTDEGGVSAHAWRSQHDAHELGDAIEAYLERHRDEFVDTWLEWDGDDATLVVAFLGDVERHQRALGSRVQVCQRPYTRAELQRVADELFDEWDDSSRGVTVMSAGAHPPDGVAFLEAVTPDPDGLRAALAERYGDMVRLEWLGPEDHVPQPVEVTGWAIADDDVTLTASWYGSGSEPLPLELTETADEVRVLARELCWVGAIAAVAVPSSQTAVLSVPLGGRPVVDVTTGRAVRPGPPVLDGLNEVQPEGTLERALRCYAERDFAAARVAFDQVARESPESLDDPHIARKRRITILRCERSAVAESGTDPAL